MKATQDYASEEKAPLLTSMENDNLASSMTPEHSPTSFWTGLRNIQCLSFVSVSVNVSTNHDEEREDDGQKTNSYLLAEKERQQQQQQPKSNEQQKLSSNDGPQGSYSTLLQSFQLFNLVSVLVNVSTNHEDERKVKPDNREKKKVPDYYQDIFGGDTKLDTGVKKNQASSHQQYHSSSKIPLLFRLRGSDRVEAFSVSTATSYADLISMIEMVAKSSPNCETSSFSGGNEEESRIKVQEIDVEWDIRDGGDRPRKTRLTEGNCEAVLLLMERGMLGELVVKMGGNVIAIF
ncbi:hypothetical protein BLS_006106 [Venturia inaequalis]|uniref:Uncharacterized protein n=1 Tax=Venturia inaequalis TaxID=5025 RepID=A0A8H3UCE3_VENIN|nr:hypothetical protein BLS_006106 [Venturia inaequalis]KAE9973034.1 hypothetical protein EG328_004646 [Venturia inaequalis]KAE9988442.1 hypothetical protein EG327_003370 [Venturia inaequalis]